MIKQKKYHRLSAARISSKFAALVITLIVCSFTNDLRAQTPVVNTIFIHSQADVDNFQNKDGIIDGDLWIEGNDIQNLAGLSEITEIKGELYIGNNDVLRYIDGLSSLIIVRDDVHIVDNRVLTNLDGLSSLMRVGGSLNVINNGNLENCCGLFPLLAFGQVLGSKNFKYNGSGCTEADILKGCSCQTCFGNIVLPSQMDVDNFPHTGCCVIHGSLTIQGSDIQNLDGLSDLTELKGNLIIRNNPLLSDMDGLSGLNNIEQSLMIRDNDHLENISGFSSLGSIGVVGGNLEISENNMLRTIDGFSILGAVGFSLIIDSNPSLNTIDGFTNLRGVGALSIDTNPSLIRINGFGSLTGVYGDVSISGTAALSEINGFYNLRSIGGRLMFIANQAQTNLDFLSSLTGVQHDVFIRYNNALTNIDGLVSLTTVGSSFALTDNMNLESCCTLYPLLAFGTIGGSIDISGNGGGCTVEDILAPGNCTDEAVEDIIDDIQPLVDLDILNSGQANALLAKLESIVEKLNQGKIKPAINQLKAFINQVQSFIDEGKLPEVEGQELIVAATDIINQVSSGGNLPKRNGDYKPPEIQNTQPEQYMLSQAYPNPFNPVTEISFSLPEESDISLIVYDALGREVKVLAQGSWNAGTHRIAFNAKNLPSGVYTYMLETGHFVEAKRMTLVK